MQSLWLTSVVEMVWESITGQPFIWSWAGSKVADILNTISFIIWAVFLIFFLYKLYVKLIKENQDTGEIKFTKWDIMSLTGQFTMFLLFITPLLWAVVSFFVDWGIN